MKAEEHFNPETVALIHTIEKGDKEQAQTMLDKGLSLNIRGEHGLTPLFYFMAKKELEAIELSLILGADPNYNAMVYSENGPSWLYPPIDAIAGDGNNKIFELLLQYGANPNTIDANGNPILFSIIGHDNWEQFDLFLKYGGDINVKDSGGRRASIYAAVLFKYDFVIKLIELGDEIYEPSKNGDTLGFTITNQIDRKERMPTYNLPGDLYIAKEMLEERGMKFPALGLKEVKERMNKGLPIQ